jgi:hypothetical protein
MHPLQVSARFAAFLWYCDRGRSGADRAEAVRFARENWPRFLPQAHEGWGKLLIRVAKLRPANGRRVRRRHAGGTQRRTTQDVAEAG